MNATGTKTEEALAKFIFISVMASFVIIGVMFGYIIGKHSADVEMQKTQESLKLEREYCGAWMELAHHYLYDNNPAHPGDPIEKNNYWFDVVMESDYYQKIDSLNNGYWEDWYCNWEQCMEAKHIFTVVQGNTVRNVVEDVIILSVTNDRVYYVRKNLRNTTMASDMHMNFTFNTKA